MRLSSQFRCHKGGSGDRAARQPSSTSKQGSCSPARCHCLSRPAEPPGTKPRSGAQPGWDDTPLPILLRRDSQSPQLRVWYLPVHSEDACDKLYSCAKGNRKQHVTVTFRPDTSYTDPSSLSLITLKCHSDKELSISELQRMFYINQYLSLPPISRELFPPNGFGRAFYDLVWMIPLLLKD